jgi:hypothetical protein
MLTTAQVCCCWMPSTRGWQVRAQLCTDQLCKTFTVKVRVLCCTLLWVACVQHGRCTLRQSPLIWCS